jgi:hypothetical protein
MVSKNVAYYPTEVSLDRDTDTNRYTQVHRCMPLTRSQLMDGF